ISQPLAIINDTAALPTGDDAASLILNVDGKEEPPAHNLSVVETGCFDPFGHVPVADFNACRLVAAEFSRGEDYMFLARANPLRSTSVLKCPYYIRRRGCTLTVDYLPHGLRDSHIWIIRERVVNYAMKLARECTYRPSEHRQQLFQWGGHMNERFGDEQFVLVISND
ncbi:MAG: hypothetical protein Q9167_004376, partial [Letrouitia subvulpina]